MPINQNKPEGKSQTKVEPLSPAEKDFVVLHEKADPAKLLLQGKRFRHLPLPKLVHYIQARQKIKLKLPLWHKNLDIVYPATLSLEQSSSALTGKFKANLVGGNCLIDLTGGFGIDSFYFAQVMQGVIYIERDAALTAVAQHNAPILGATNISFYPAEATNFLQNYAGKADWIYLDPARRDTANKKVHLLADCEPDILQLLPLLLTKAENILLKTSPMLDIAQAAQQLKAVQNIYVVAVENECKEVLYHISRNKISSPAVVTVNLLPDNKEQRFIFGFGTEEETAVNYAAPATFIYEPNAAILKAGGFKSVAQAYGLYKLNRNSHLYTTDTLVPDFPGRIFILKAICRYQQKELLPYLPEKKANITVRNFPETVAQIRAKTGIKEGGNIYLFATTDMHQKPIILVCGKAVSS